MPFSRLTDAITKLCEAAGKLEDGQIQAEVEQATGGGSVLDVIVAPAFHDVAKELFKLYDGQILSSGSYSPSAQLIPDGWVWFYGSIISPVGVNSLYAMAADPVQYAEAIKTAGRGPLIAHLGYLQTYRCGHPYIIKRIFTTNGESCDTSRMMGWYQEIDQVKLTQKRPEQLIPAELTQADYREAAFVAWHYANHKINTQLEQLKTQKHITDHDIVWEPNR